MTLERFSFKIHSKFSTFFVGRIILRAIADELCMFQIYLPVTPIGFSVVQLTPIKKKKWEKKCPFVLQAQMKTKNKISIYFEHKYI